MNRLMPIGGARYAISRLSRKMIAKWNGSRPYARREGQHQRHGHDDRREDLHQHADDQQEDVEHDEEQQLRVRSATEEVEQLGRDLGLNQPRGEAHGHAMIMRIAPTSVIDRHDARQILADAMSL